MLARYSRFSASCKQRKKSLSKIRPQDSRHHHSPDGSHRPHPQDSQTVTVTYRDSVIVGHVHFKLVARQQLGVAVGSLAAGEPPREKLFILAMEATVPREGKRREERGERRKKRRRRKKRGRREEKRGEEEEERKEGGKEGRGGRREERGRRGEERRRRERRRRRRGRREEKVKHWLQISTHVMLYFLLTTVQSCVKDLTQSRTRRSSERLVRREREGGRKSHIANHSTKSNFYSQSDGQTHRLWLHPTQTWRALTWQVLARESPGFDASVGGW